MKTYRLENWGVTIHPDDNPYLAPEQYRSSLFGEVYGHYNFDDGTAVITSPIKGIEGDDIIVTASGSFYELGEINPAYETSFPGAKDRLIDSLKKMRDNV